MLFLTIVKAVPQVELNSPWFLSHYGGLLCRLPDLVGHPLREIAVFGLSLLSLHKRDAGSAGFGFGCEAVRCYRKRPSSRARR